MSEGTEESESLLGKKQSQPGSEATNEPASTRLSGFLSCVPTGFAFQWIGLLLIAMITFGTSVAYDSIGALGPVIRNKMHIDPEGLADLYSVYHLPNLVLVFFGGLLSDRIGPRKASLVFSAAVVFGVVLVAVSNGLFGMLLGRFIFGMGSESLSVVQLGILTRWYSRVETTPSLGLACAFSLTINRLGTLVAFDVLPVLAEGHTNGLKRALIFVVVVCVFCLCCNLGYIFMDTQLTPFLPGEADAATSNSSGEALAGGKKTAIYARTDGIDESLTFYGVLSNLRKFTTSYWLIVLICICHYSVMIAYSDFAADFYHEQWGFPAKKASQIQSITTVIGLIFTPVMGQVVDRFGHRVHFMLIGSALLLPAHLSVSVINMGPVLSSILQGLASALVCSSLWPSIALVLPYPLVNTAVGLMTALQNTALFTVPLIVGALRVKTGHYTAGMFFYLALDAVAVVACIQLLTRKDQSGTNILVMNAQQIRRFSLSNTGALDADDQACQDSDTSKSKDDTL